MIAIKLNVDGGITPGGWCFWRVDVIGETWSIKLLLLQFQILTDQQNHIELSAAVWDNEKLFYHGS